MKKMLLLLIIPLLTLSAFDYEGYPDWENYLNGKTITCINSKGDDIWIGSSGGGLIHINIETNEKTFYDRSNSGIPNNHITEILIDNYGNKWIGTTNGLVKFDGTNWTTFKNENSEISKYYITALAHDNEGKIWVGTYGGLFEYNNSVWTKYTPENSDINTSGISCIAVDYDNNVWIGFYNDFICMYDGKKWNKYENENYLGSPYSIFDIDVDGNNNIWIGTENFFITKFDRQNWTEYQYNEHWGNRCGITDMTIGKNGYMWIGVRMYGFDAVGFSEFNGQKILETYNMKNSPLPDNKINAIHIDKNGDKWIGTDEGLMKFDGENWERISTSKEEFFNNGFREIIIDKFDNKWIISGSDKQILKYDNEEWYEFGGKDSIFDGQRINAFTEDIRGNIWVATDSSIYSFSNNNWIKYDKSYYQELNSSISKMNTDYAGNPWLMTSTQIAKLDGEKWLFFNFPDSLYHQNHNPIKSFDIDINGNVWILSQWGSLIKFDGKEWFEYDSTNSHFKKNRYNHIKTDKNNNIWLSDKSLFKFNNNEFKKYNIKDTILSPYFNFVYINIDNDGLIWASTSEGLTTFDNEEWNIFSKENSGIAENLNWQFAFDKDDNIWIIHENALSYYKRNATDIQDNVVKPAFTLINYPNPFSSSTTISYELEQAGYVSIRVFDSFGKEISTLVNKTMQAGSHTAEFNSAGLSSGTYYYTIKANNKTESGKFVIVK